jgi:hypothetical protein
MKSIIASVFAVALLGATAASAQVHVGVHVNSGHVVVRTHRVYHRPVYHRTVVRRTVVHRTVYHRPVIAVRLGAGRHCWWHLHHHYCR